MVPWLRESVVMDGQRSLSSCVRFQEVLGKPNERRFLLISISLSAGGHWLWLEWQMSRNSFEVKKDLNCNIFLETDRTLLLAWYNVFLHQIIQTEEHLKQKACKNKHTISVFWDTIFWHKAEKYYWKYKFKAKEWSYLCFSVC